MLAAVDVLALRIPLFCALQESRLWPEEAAIGAAREIPTIPWALWLGLCRLFGTDTRLLRESLAGEMLLACHMLALPALVTLRRSAPSRRWRIANGVAFWTGAGVLALSLALLIAAARQERFTLEDYRAAWETLILRDGVDTRFAADYCRYLAEDESEPPPELLEQLDEPSRQRLLDLFEEERRRIEMIRGFRGTGTEGAAPPGDG